MVGRKAVDDVVGAGVLLSVTVEVAMIGLYLVVRADDGLVEYDQTPFTFADWQIATRRFAIRRTIPQNHSLSTTAPKTMAERVGFEPTLPFRVNTLSKRAPSATRPSLRRNLGGTIAPEKLSLPELAGTGTNWASLILWAVAM
jgi:hypothetical protein